MCDEKNTGTNLPAQIELYSTAQGPKAEYKFLFMAKGGGSANKIVPVPGDQGAAQPDPDAGVPRREDPLARHGRLPAVPPGGRDRRHVGRVRAEDREATPRPTTSTTCRPRARMAAHGVPRPGAGGGGPQADPVVRHRRAVRRQVLLPRRARGAAAAPRRLLPGRRSRSPARPTARRSARSPPRASSSSSSRPTPRSTCRTPASPRTSPAARWSRSTSTGRWPRSGPSCRSTRSRRGCR